MFKISRLQMEKYRLYKKLSRFKPSSNMDRAYTAVATPLLNSLGYDLTLAAKLGRLELCVAREKEISAIFESMKSGAQGIVLTGRKAAATDDNRRIGRGNGV
jgi:ATP-dependent Clp protease ATP-binding subunit ClpA